MTNVFDRLRAEYGPEVIQTIYARYMEAGVTNKQVIEEFSIPLPPSGLLRLFPDIVRDDKPCRHCQTPTVQEARRKTQRLDNPFRCPSCGHYEIDATTISLTTSWRSHFECSCVYCMTDRKVQSIVEREARQNKLLEWIATQAAETTPPPYSRLSLREKMLLLARLLCGETGDYIPSISDLGPDLWVMPTSEASDAVDLMMYRAGILIIAPSTPPTAFNEDFSEVVVDQLRWEHNIADAHGELFEAPELLKKLVEEINSQPKGIIDTCRGLLQELAIEETMRALGQLLAKTRLRFASHDKAREALVTLAGDHSIEALRFYASKAVTSATTYWKGRSREPGSTIPKGLVSAAEVARRDFWTIPGWERDSKSPRSMLAEVLFRGAFSGKADHLELNSPPWKILAAVWPAALPAADPAEVSLNSATLPASSPRCVHCGTSNVAVRFEDLQISVNCLAPGCMKGEHYHRLAFGGQCS
ncbi:hypothetical protein [Geopseudomonas aromaticivorans]